ncbi:hypothetical protein NPD5_2602 [Clostridium sporogenes]|uniref:Uncharacterized protein n=1 Tax=Clostridium sporogenes TaxID=1509 RepID=A0A1L3NJB1_CLOSG|nr:hypothetical protein [Clostridium sporogenes]APH16209.1 hypothetical protein NPD5_2602 [Clostridium sporogenes]
MDRIDFKTGNGIYTFQTVSGSKYILKIGDEKIFIKRSPQNKELSLRKDNEEIEVFKFMPIELGKVAILKLKPLGKGNCTLRITTKVIEISKVRVLGD